MTADRRLRVLLVDDDGPQLEMMRRILSSEGFDVETTESPIGVSNLARKFSPDVILLDVNIPALSGDQLIPVLRRNADGKRTRLVLFSACDPEHLRRLAGKVGADAWIEKGEDPGALAFRLRMICVA